MAYRLDLGQWNTIFAVPAAVVDSHLKLATEAQLKVLLYLLRHAGEETDEETLASALNISLEEIKNAVDFWREREVLTLSDGMLVPSDKQSEHTAPITPAEPKEEKPAEKPRTTISRAQRPDQLYVGKLLKEDKLLAGLLEDAQQIMKKPLSPGDTATLVMLYDSFGLPCEVIALLMNYLSASGNANMRTIERLGIRWADEGIRTAEDAEREIERMMNSREAWKKISELFGFRTIGNPTKSQLEHADRWLNEWHFNDEMITEAYERCVDKKGVYDIRYINGILKRWHEKGVKSLDSLKQSEDASKKQQKVKNKSGKGSMFTLDGASFDVKKYEEDTLFDD